MFGRLKAQDDGFTLIELLVAIMISGLILGAVATAFVVTMAGSQNLHDRFVESHDAQLLATYLPSDVQSANPTMIDDAGVPECTGEDASSVNVVRLLWTQSDGITKTVFSASYRIVNSSSGSTLYRYFCSNAGPAASTEQAILNGTAATSHIVASDLSNVHAPVVNVDLDKSRIDLTLYSHQTPSEQRASIPEYSYTFSATMRTLGVFIPFVLSDPTPGPKTAGQFFLVTVTAKTADGSTTDTSYTGSKTLLFSGAAASPNGTAPTGTVTVTFSLGVANLVSVTLVDAVPTSLNVSQGTHRTWAPLPLTVGAGPFAPGPLSFSPCPSDFTQGQTATLQVTRTMTDASGNAVTAAGSAQVTLSAPAGTFSAPSVTIPINTATSGSFTFTNPGTSGTQTTLTGQTAGYDDATCSVTTTPTPSTTTTSTTTTTTSTSTTTTTVPPPPAPSVTPSSTQNNQVDLIFSDTQAGVTFECQVDGGAFSACTSPKHYQGNTYAGTHSYGVHAVDSAGRVSPTTTKTQAA